MTETWKTPTFTSVTFVTTKTTAIATTTTINIKTATVLAGW